MEADDTHLGETAPGVRRRAPVLGPGAKLGRFVLLDKVGAGAMGVVFAAYDPQLDRRVAIKVVDEQRIGSGSSGRARLLREARAIAQISHPNVVVVHESGEHGDQVWLAMEFVDGVTLRGWCAAGHPFRDTVGCFAAAARGLAAVHRAGMIHRDFKPDNVMIQGIGAADPPGSGRVVVMDFGLASEPLAPAATGQHPRDASRRDPELVTATGTLLGTPRYMSPEQWQGAEIDARSDQFAFCVALFEALYAVPPFRGDTIAELAETTTKGEVRSDVPRSDVPTWLQRVLLRGLQREPAHRFADMDALLAALGRDPTRRRRALAIAAATVGVASAGWGWLQLAERQRHDDCIAGVTEQHAAGWNDAARERVHLAFLASAQPSASGTADRVAARLDRTVARLHELALERCDATAPPPVDDATEECLARVGVEVDELVTVFAHADANVVRHAISAVDHVTPPDTCTRTDAAAAIAEPSDPAARQAARATRQRIARLSMRGAASLDADALAEADATIAEAERIGHRATLADALLARAKIRHRTDDLDGSVADAERAFHLALACGHDATAVDAADRLGWVIGWLREEINAGRKWVQIGSSLLERLSGPQQLRRATLLATAGQIESAAGDNTHAMEIQQQALELLVAELGDQDLRVAGVLQHLGAAAVELGRYAEGIEYHERALAIRTAELGEIDPLVSISLAGIGTAWLERGDLDRAESYYRRALDIRVASLPAEDVSIARDWGNLANVATRRGRYDEAIETYETALRIKERALGPDDVSVAVTLLNLGHVRHEVDDFAGAEADYRRALAIRERKHGSEHPGVATVLNNLALTLRLQGREVEARAVLERALAIRTATLGRDHPSTASSIGNLALSYSDAEDHARALPLYRESLALLERTHGADSPALAPVLGDYGTAAFRSGDAELGARLIERALALLDVHAPHTPKASWNRFRLAKIREQTGAHDEALALARAALVDAENTTRDEITAWIADHQR